MGYNETLDERITKVLSTWEDIGRKKMFGGVCFLMHGNMLCGVYRDYLILRLGEKEAGEALEGPFVREFDITGRPMKGWVMVEEKAFRGPKLEEWLKKAKVFVGTLPRK